MDESSNDDAAIRREEDEVWSPLLLRMAALLAETVEDGWPCRRFPAGWHARAQRALDDFRGARELHRVSPAPGDPTGDLARLRGYLDETVDDRSRLSRRDLEGIRRILTAHRSEG